MLPVVLLLGTVLVGLFVGSMKTLTITRAQGDDAECRALFPEIYAIVDNVNYGAYCVNSTDDAADYYIEPTRPKVCDSDDATPGNQCTLRAAIMTANAKPFSVRDYILLPPGTYKLSIPNDPIGSDEDSCQTGDLDVFSTVYIKGVSKEQVTIDANKIDRAFHIRYEQSHPTFVEISDVTIINGRRSTNSKWPAGAIYNNGYLTVTNTLIKNYDDAGIANMRNSTEFTSTLVVINSVIDGDGTTNSRGIHVNGGTVTIQGSTIKNNLVTTGISNGKDGGAGIYIAKGFISVPTTTVTLINSTVSDNKTQGTNLKGGGIYVGQVVLGTLYQPIELRLINSTVKDNQADVGGGIYADGGNVGPVVRLNGSTVSGNVAQDDKNTIIAGLGGGGGIYQNSPSTMVLNNSTISGNKTNAHGGGIYVSETPNDNVSEVRDVSLTDCTVTNNTANVDKNDIGDGGGIYLKPKYRTVSGVFVLLFENSGLAVLKNTILAGNFDGSIIDLDNQPDGSYYDKESGIYAVYPYHPKTPTMGRFVSLGYNLIGNNRGIEVSFPSSKRVAYKPSPPFPEPTSDGFCLPEPNTAPPNQHIIKNDNSDWVGSPREDKDCQNVTGPIDPQLLSLRDNGGGVETHALKTSDEPTNATLEKRSFAIDNGDCADTPLDQRGAPRPQDGDNLNGEACDIGAYEVVQNDVSVLKHASTDDVASSQRLTYTLDFVNQGSMGATNVEITDLIPDNLTSRSFSSDKTGVTKKSGQDYTWQLPNLKPGDGGVITVSGIVNPDLSKLVIMKNAVTIQEAETDQMPSNNTSMVDTVARPGADLAISIAVSRDPAPISKAFSYTIFITNSGPAIATGVMVVDTLPTNTTFNSKSSSTSCTYDTKTRTVTCKVPTLGVGANSKLIIDLTPSKAMTITNDVSVSSDQPDPYPANNLAEITTQILPDVDVGVKLAVSPDPGTTGKPLTYTITITNRGPQDATGLSLTDTWPDSVNLQNVNAGLFNCDNIDYDKRTIICTLSLLKKDAKAIVEMIVKPLLPNPIQNKVWIDTSAADSDLSNNFVSITTTIKGTPMGVTPTPTPSATPTGLSPTKTPLPIATPTPTMTPIPVLPAVECTISPSQGCVVFPVGTDNNWVKVEFPTGAVEKYTTTVTLIAGGAIPHPQTGDLRFAVRAFKVTAEDNISGPVSTFKKPYTITLRYIYSDYKHLFTNADSKRILDLYYWDGTQWLRAFDPANPCAGCSRSTSDTDIGTVINVQLNHLTEFALMAEMKTVYLPVIIKK